jgi:arginase
LKPSSENKPLEEICKCSLNHAGVDGVHMKRIVNIVEAPSNLGLKAPSYGTEPGVKLLPEWLKKWGLYDSIQPRTIHTTTPPAYLGELDRPSGVLNADQIADYSQQLANLVSSLIKENVFPIVIGGDCSVLIGNMLALKSIGNYALLFLDGHTDYAWPPMSQSGGAAGMDLAIVTGHGHEKLTNIWGLRPYVTEKQVWSLANRDFDQAYLEAIQSSAIQYVDLPTLRKRGLTTCASEFLAMVEEQNLSGFWIHLDVDVLDDELMPAVDSRQPEGLTYDELNTILNTLLSSEKAAGLEITILDPMLDQSSGITQQFIHALQPILEKHLKNAY